MDVYVGREGEAWGPMGRKGHTCPASVGGASEQVGRKVAQHWEGAWYMGRVGGGVQTGGAPGQRWPAWMGQASAWVREREAACESRAREAGGTRGACIGGEVHGAV